MTLSICIICKNEQEVIGKCLDSVKDADEIIIQDTGSTDGTLEIVKQYPNVKIFTDYLWSDDFAEARNHAKSKASGGWILSIDCDEVLEPNGIQKIKELIETETHKTIDVKMVSGSNSFNFPRLYRNLPEIQWSGCWHNVLNVVECNAKDITIYYSYSPAHALDPDRRIRMGLKAVNLYPNSPRHKFYLAREYMYKKDWNNAIKYFNDYFKIANWVPEWCYAYYLAAQCYAKLNNLDEAKNHCLYALKLNSNFKDCIRLLARLSGEGNKKRWWEFAKTATNEALVFVDDDFEPKEPLEICMVTYKRLYRFHKTIEQLNNQTLRNWKLNVWNNSNEKIPLGVFNPDKVSIINSDSNLGSIARFHLTKYIKGDIIVFIDDDLIMEDTFLEYMYKQYRKFGKYCILGWHTRNFINNNYWEAERKAGYGSNVDYIGTGGMILNKSIFNSPTDVLNPKPEFIQAEDLYLSYIAQKRDYRLKKIDAPCSIDVDGNDQYQNLIEYKQHALDELIKLGYLTEKDGNNIYLDYNGVQRKV